MNAPIQGLAADIFKVALVRLDEALERAAATGAAGSPEGADLVLQVHDEVILEVPPAEHDDVEAITRDVMGHAADLRVPLEVNLSFGRSWADAK